jgi:hypothetical protein
VRQCVKRNWKASRNGAGLFISIVRFALHREGIDRIDEERSRACCLCALAVCVYAEDAIRAVA